MQVDSASEAALAHYLLGSYYYYVEFLFQRVPQVYPYNSKNRSYCGPSYYTTKTSTQAKNQWPSDGKTDQRSQYQMNLQEPPVLRGRPKMQNRSNAGWCRLQAFQLEDSSTDSRKPIVSRTWSKDRVDS